MLNILAQSRATAGVQNAMALIEGHHKFLNYNTGQTDNPQLQHYAVNPQGVLSNNRHFIAASQMEYQPNGDGTTEGQALQIIGYCYAYLATKDQKYLDKAIWFWNAYVAYYYAGDPVPAIPERWIANWIVNSKEPVLSNWPVDAAAPTHSGFKGSMMTFTNGVCKVPRDAPNWGQYIDKATFAFDGYLTWDAINASVQYIDENGTVDWSRDGTIYDIDWIINWEGKKINWDGDVLSTGHTEDEKGTCALKDLSVQGAHKFNYATRQPVADGGYLIPRNAVQHNRPLHVPLLGTRNQRGNAADAEQWFYEACYLLFKITGEDKYQKAMAACHFTTMEYTDIDSSDMFFRQSKDAGTPFTDGIAYDFTYPSDIPVVYGRDTDGYITVAAPQKVTLSMEQQAVWFRVSQASSVRTTYGGVGVAGGPLSASVRLVMNPLKQESGGLSWIAAVPDSTDATIKVIDTPINQFVQATKSDGSEYILADLRAVSSADAIVSKSVFVTNILDGRSAKVVESFFPDDDPWYAIGNYLQPTGKAPMISITYKADADFNLRFSDDNLWRWWWMLPNTNGQWVTKQILKSEGTLSSYQPDHASGDPRPTFPTYDQIEEFSILFDDSSTVNATFSYYCINDIPPRFLAEDGYTMNYRLTLDCADAGWNAKVGNCTVINYRKDNLAYTPGVIPFSNIYEEGTDQIGAWHGMPYPGYQYPFIYTLAPETYSTQLNNMVNFLYDSQAFYTNKFSVAGPVASAYIWNRWDNYKYGTPDTFTMYHWGDGNAWSGYQPRAFQGACRAWQELVYRGKAVPEKLILYCNTWITYLARFLRENNGLTPTEFPADRPAYTDPNDFTGHMTALWLSGAAMAGMAGSTNPDVSFVVESCLTELTNNYVNTGIPGQIMNGSWSPAVRLETGNGVESNGMFFGFWSGETLRALGMYILYKTKKPLEPIY